MCFRVVYVTAKELTDNVYKRVKTVFIFSHIQANSLKSRDLI